MNGRGLAEVGLFLLLAFVLPGFVYLGFFIWYFPNVFQNTVVTFGFKDDMTLFVFAAGIIGGLLLTSICFAIELLLRKWKFFNDKMFPSMNISRLAVIEARGRSTLYLRQVTGQAIMHFNIAMGLFIPIVPLYVCYFIFSDDNKACLPDFYLKLITGCALILVNFYVSHLFYSWGQQAICDVDKIP